MWQVSYASSEVSGSVFAESNHRGRTTASPGGGGGQRGAATKPGMDLLPPPPPFVDWQLNCGMVHLWGWAVAL